MASKCGLFCDSLTAPSIRFIWIVNELMPTLGLHLFLNCKKLAFVHACICPRCYEKETAKKQISAPKELKFQWKSLTIINPGAQCTRYQGIKGKKSNSRNLKGFFISSLELRILLALASFWTSNRPKLFPVSVFAYAVPVAGILFLYIFTWLASSIIQNSAQISPSLSSFLFTLSKIVSPP